MNWTETHGDEACHLFMSGWSAGAVAKHIGEKLRCSLSRNAVIGLVYRRGLKREGASYPCINLRFGVPNPRKGTGKPKDPRAPRISRPKKLKLTLERSRLKPPVPVEAPTVFDISHAKLWTERAFGECAYPVAGEGADPRSCCAKTAGTYCRAHQKVMFYTPRVTLGHLTRMVMKVAA